MLLIATADLYSERWEILMLTKFITTTVDQVLLRVILTAGCFENGFHKLIILVAAYVAQ